MKYVIESCVLTRDINHETILVNTIHNQFIHLNLTAGLALNYLNTPHSTAELLEYFSMLFPDVTIATLAQDIDEILAYFLERNLVRPCDREPLEKGKIALKEWRDTLDSFGATYGAPVWAKIEIDTKCHLRCAHCYIPEVNRDFITTPTPGLNLAEIVNLLDQLKELGCLLVTFTGGEIFLRKDMLAIIQAAHERGFVIELFTSGTPLTPEKVAYLKAVNIGRVQISVYSHEEATHDRFTGKAGSWQRSLRAARMLVEAGIEVEIACSILPHNVSHLQELKAMCAELGVTLALGYPITAQTDGNLTPHSLRLDPDQLEQAIRDQPAFFALPDPRDDQGRICTAGVSMCSITAEGDILPCSQFHLVGGNIRKDQLSQIWNESEVFQHVRRQRLRDIALDDPEGKLQLVGHCPGLNLLENGNFLKPAQITLDTTNAVRRLLQDPQLDPDLYLALTTPTHERMRKEA